MGNWGPVCTRARGQRSVRDKDGGDASPYIDSLRTWLIFTFLKSLVQTLNFHYSNHRQCPVKRRDE